LFTLFLILATGLCAQAAGKRIALVIGNANYRR